MTLRSYDLFRVSLALWAAAGCWQLTHGAEVAPEDPAIAEMKVVDADMARFTEMLKVYDDPYYKPRIMVFYNAIALRIEALRQSFDQQKADDLRFDLNQQVQRMAVALRPLITPPPGEGPGLELSKLKPSPGNRAEIAAALAALDSAIARLESEAKAGAAGQPELMAKFERVRQGRVALGKSFTAAGWAALTKDLETPLRIQWRPRPVKSTPAAVADAAAK